MIIGFLGRKQSGKNTCSNILHGIELLKMGMIQEYKILNGKLWVLTSNAEGKIDWGEFDVTRKDGDFTQWADLHMWPYIKNYSFADSLKDIAINLFNIPHKCVYGTDKDKETVIEHLLWENMPGVIDTDNYLSLTNNHHGGMGKYLATKLYPHNNGPMTAREFMQFFGSEIMRKMWQPIWINKTLNQILKEKSRISIISDVRFPNEVEAIKNIGGIIIKLHRKQKTKNLHQSEMGVDLVPPKAVDINIFNNKKDSSLEKLQQEIKNIYDTIIL